ncbi:MAG: hypothetical protein ACKV0T_15480, partial [Planctomycetales bacterium]
MIAQLVHTILPASVGSASVNGPLDRGQVSSLERSGGEKLTTGAKWGAAAPLLQLPHGSGFGGEFVLFRSLWRSLQLTIKLPGASATRRSSRRRSARSVPLSEAAVVLEWRRLLSSTAGASLADTTPLRTLEQVQGTPLTDVAVVTFTDATPTSANVFQVAHLDWGGTLQGTLPALSIQLDPDFGGPGTGWRVMADTVTYADLGLFTPTVTVRDMLGNELQSSQTRFQVLPPPTLVDTTAPVQLSAIEGTSLSNVVLMTFSDRNQGAQPGDFSITSLNWGGTIAGTAPTLSVTADETYTGSGSGWKVTLDTLTYADNGTFTAEVTLQDSSGSSVTSTKTSFKVADAVLSDTTPQATTEAVEGIPLTRAVIMTFTDGNPYAPVDDFSLTSLSWGGDLAGPDPVVRIVIDTSYEGPGSGWKVVADSVTFADIGFYVVGVTVRNSDGNMVDTASASFRVGDAPHTDTTPEQTILATEQVASSNVVLMTFTDDNPLASVRDFFVTSLNWGGELARQLPVLSIVSDRFAAGKGSGWMVLADAITYARAGNYSVSLTVQDIDGGVVTTDKTQFAVIDAKLRDTTKARTIELAQWESAADVVLMTLTDDNP